jgi:hypothetical protein
MITPESRMMRVPEAVFAVTGVKPSPSKCWRWYQKGIKGVVLQTWLVGGSRMTTTEAVLEFISRRTGDVSRRRPVLRRKPKLCQGVKEVLNRELGICLK